MMRLIGVMFIAILAQFLVHGWNHFAVFSGDDAIEAWKNELDRLAKKARHE